VDNLEQASFEEQFEMQKRLVPQATLAYAENLLAKGHEVFVSMADHYFIQRAWAKENNINIDIDKMDTLYRQWEIIKNIHSQNKPFRIFYKTILKLGYKDIISFYNKILFKQIEMFNPDLIWNIGNTIFKHNLFDNFKNCLKIVEIDGAVTVEKNLNKYDFVRCSLPSHAKDLKINNIDFQQYSFAFESKWLKNIEKKEKKIDLGFIGSLSPIHKGRIKYLEFLCNHFENIKIWAPTLAGVDKNSPIRKVYEGELVGIDNLQKMAEIKIVLNYQVDTSNDYCDNIRLFETTGVGAFLLTDMKNNLSNFYTIGEEIIAHQGAESSLNLIKYYLKNEKEREIIAQKGQKKTLIQYSYKEQIELFLDYLNYFLKKQGKVI
jgi:hypothetical protein